MKRMNRTLEGYRLVSRQVAAGRRAFGKDVETVQLEVRSEASDPSWGDERGTHRAWAQGRRTYHRHHTPRARARKKSRRQMAKASKRANR